MGKIIKLIFALFTAATISTVAYAASFQSLEQSAARLGTADAGTATNTDDAAIEYYNPAGMPLLGHRAISLSGIQVIANIKMKDVHATDYNNQTITKDVSGPETQGLMPGVHFVQPLSNKLAIGFGFTVPYGLSTIYPDDSIARYFATESIIKTYNFAVSAGYKITPNILIGAGVDAQKMTAELDEAVDAKSIVPIFQNDVLVKNNGTSWGVGFNAGVLFLFPSHDSRIGLAYRSQIHHELHGRSTVYTIGDDYHYRSILHTLNLIDSDVDSSTTLPASLTLSLQHRFTSKWSMYSDIAYTFWSCLNGIKLIFSEPKHNPPFVNVKLNYHNAWRLAFGQSYKITNKLTLKNGIAFDQTPTDTTYKTARIPDANRYWVTIGAHYQVSKHFSFDGGYALIIFERSRINLSEQNPSDSSKNFTLNAQYRALANLIGIQVNYHFDE